jgi:hypothetical protein
MAAKEPAKTNKPKALRKAKKLEAAKPLARNTSLRQFSRA